VPKWHHAPGQNYLASPTVAGGAVFIGSDGTVDTVDTASIATDPRDHQPTVYVAGANGYLYALSAANLRLKRKSAVFYTVPRGHGSLPAPVTRRCVAEAQRCVSEARQRSSRSAVAARHPQLRPRAAADGRCRRTCGGLTVGATTSTALWYASRSTGVVALVLLTVVIVLGILVNRKRSLPGLPRFATTTLHRNLSLLAVAFVVVHVITAIADPYVTIGIAAAIVPFTSPYETLWLGLGTVALDVMIAVIITSLLRARIGRRTWRAVHWLSYAFWPVALAHSIGSSTDMQRGGLLGLAVACIAAVLAAAAWRLVTALREPERAALPGLELAAADRAPARTDRVSAGIGAR
jgi:methionine sulfoxide reductase heme-binding subunit